MLQDLMLLLIEGVVKYVLRTCYYDPCLEAMTCQAIDGVLEIFFAGELSNIPSLPC